MSSNSSLKRAARIKKRCIRPVIEALQAGKISARSADIFLKLSRGKQQAELNRRLDEIREREAQHRRVAVVIKSYLDGLDGQKVDLHRLGGVIRSAAGQREPGS